MRIVDRLIYGTARFLGLFLGYGARTYPTSDERWATFARKVGDE